MNYIIRRNFLDPALDAAIRIVMRMPSIYVPATVTGDASWRSGMVAHVEGRPEARAVAEAVLKAVPAVSYALRIDAFTPSRCEVQLSCYGDGDRFLSHTDNGSPDAADRVLSWVIYVDLVKPRRWTGGGLVLNDGTDAEVVYAPEDGAAIFFPSTMLHQVMGVNAPDEWNTRRHTVNGWVRR